MNALGELAELLDGGRELVDRTRERLVPVDVPALGVAQVEQKRDQPLLRAVVKIALEPPPGVVGGRDDARSRVADLALVPLAIGDVDTGDQVDGPARDHRQRRAGPLDLDRGAVPLQPAALATGHRLRPHRFQDRVAGGGALAVDDVALPEVAAAGLLGVVAERALEGPVRRVRPASCRRR